MFNIVWKIASRVSKKKSEKILFGGVFTSYDGTSRNYTIRLNDNGIEDTGFSIGTGFDNTVNIIAIQSDGKILVGGLFTSYNGTSSNRIIRLNDDGSIDSSFSIGTGFNNTVNAIAIQSDGKILVGGLFTSYQGMTSKNRIILLNSDGSENTNFNQSTRFNNTVNTIVIRDDEKIFVGGAFTLYLAQSKPRIVLLNPNGSIVSFGPSLSSFFDNTVNIIAIQSDGKILVGGLFASYSGTSSNRIIRLNDDGSIDSSFSIGTGFNNTVNAIAIQSDGKILVGGLFTSYNGTSSNRIIRLNTDGSEDTSFSIGTGFNNTVNSFVLEV